MNGARAYLEQQLEALRAFWWRLWTGQPSLEAKRRELEEECRRFGAVELPRWE